jgi:methylase of polypeptide subunit release factors
VTDGEWDALPPSVRQEPRIALTSGTDGLDAIRRLLVQAKRALNPSGLILIEIGEQQGNAAQALAQTAFPDARVQIILDLAGKPRLLKIIPNP